MRLGWIIISHHNHNYEVYNQYNGMSSGLWTLFIWIDDVPWDIPPPRLIGNLPLKMRTTVLGWSLIMMEDQMIISMFKSQEDVWIYHHPTSSRWFVHDDWIKMISVINSNWFTGLWESLLDPCEPKQIECMTVGDTVPQPSLAAATNMRDAMVDKLTLHMLGTSLGVILFPKRSIGKYFFHWQFNSKCE